MSLKTITPPFPERPLPSAAPDPAPVWLPIVLAGVESLDFGTVQIVVHDHRVVQVERLERHRFDLPRGGKPSEGK